MHFYNEDKTEDYYYRTGETDEALAKRVKETVDKAVEKGYKEVKANTFRRLSGTVQPRIFKYWTDSV